MDSVYYVMRLLRFCISYMHDDYFQCLQLLMMITKMIYYHMYFLIDTYPILACVWCACLSCMFAFIRRV